MAYAGIRLFEVSTIIGFIVLQIVLIQKQKYTTSMIASVVYIPGAYFLKHFLYGSSAAVSTIKTKQYLNTLTNDRELRGSPVRAAPTLRSSLITPDASTPNKRVTFSGIPELKQNGLEQLADTMLQAGLSDGPAIFSRAPITVTPSTLSPRQVVEVSTYDHALPEVSADIKALRQQQSNATEARRQQEMAEMSDRLAQKFSKFNNNFSTFKSQFAQNAELPVRVQNTDGPIWRV